ncbi:hypothetical protein CAPTEDRAFT_219489 [Capitella teleta]|uniref:SUEL-type lectin domain-containing protein n=1 Tax=Capitella teleta TaxID=283909 RepID=X2APM7_CAPTE|nr:hypothetical protein CAPTEDRAFT_219489 [Capitella teleta]|eukprot:ELU10136.1 hypothetical protein CAPTEDRAFT_219489 [Capitella teleta]
MTLLDVGFWRRLLLGQAQERHRSAKNEIEDDAAISVYIRSARGPEIGHTAVVQMTGSRTCCCGTLSLILTPLVSPVRSSSRAGPAMKRCVQIIETETKISVACGCLGNDVVDFRRQRFPGNYGKGKSVVIETRKGDRQVVGLQRTGNVNRVYLGALMDIRDKKCPWSIIPPERIHLWVARSLLQPPRLFAPAFFQHFVLNNTRTINYELHQLSHCILFNHAFTCRVVTCTANDISCFRASADFCENETFTAQCSDNEVILMTQAIYGRMKVGRCITGQSGCSYDVLSIMDQKCSGRRRCDVDIRDLFVAIPQSICDRNLRNYLQAAYTCLRVAIPPTKRCYKTPVQIEATSGGHIASYVTAETGCGNYDSPWLIKVEPGQKINVTLYDFGLASNLNDDKDKTCQVLTVIKDASVTSSSKTVCSGPQRIRAEFLSRANEIEIRIIAGLTDGNEEDRTHFVLKYDVYGCANLNVNSDTMFRRINDDIAELSCTSSGDAWRVTCKGTKWEGHVTNCTEGSGGSGSLAASTSLSLFSLPSGLSVAIVIIIAVLIGLVILTVGLVMIKRRRTQQDNPVPEVRHPKYDLDYSGPHACHYEATAPDSMYKANDHFGNAYYRTWELQRPQPQGVGAHGSSLPPITPSETYGPDSEHIYESPKSLRREIRAAADPALQYYELDPNSPDDSAKGKFPAV